jgi:hypothetical protein
VKRVLGIVVILIGFHLAGFGQVPESNSHYSISKAISVYPNPTVDDYIHVKLDVLKAATVRLALHNIIGSEVPTESEIVNEHEVRIRIKDLASGYYLLAVRDDETKFRGTYKFLKR